MGGQSYLRDTHEYILIFSKDSYSRNASGKENTISKEDFLAFTKSVWEFPSESAKARPSRAVSVGIATPMHPTLYFKDDIILDPFCGVGSSCLAPFATGGISSVMKSMKNMLARRIGALKGYKMHHNYFGTHERLSGKTPAEIAGICIEGKNKWITVIQNASKLAN